MGARRPISSTVTAIVIVLTASMIGILLQTGQTRYASLAAPTAIGVGTILENVSNVIPQEFSNLEYASAPQAPLEPPLHPPVQTVPPAVRVAPLEQPLALSVSKILCKAETLAPARLLTSTRRGAPAASLVIPPVPPALMVQAQGA